MTMTESLMTVGKVVMNGLKAVGALFAAANPLTLINVGIFAGVAAFTTYCCIKNAKAKRDYARNKNKRTPVERAVELNYADARNQENLHPKLDRVCRQFGNSRTMEKFNRNAARHNSFTRYKKTPDATLDRLSRELDRIVARTALGSTYADIYNNGRFMNRNVVDDMEKFNQMMKDSYRMSARHIDDHALLTDPFYLTSIIHDPSI